MKALARTAILSLSVMGLAACTGMQERSDSAYVVPQRSPSIIDDDVAYMARVERMARQRGIHLVWVNKPRKMVAKNTDD